MFPKIDNVPSEEIKEFSPTTHLERRLKQEVNTLQGQRDDLFEVALELQAWIGREGFFVSKRVDRILREFGLDPSEDPVSSGQKYLEWLEKKGRVGDRNG